MMFDHLDIHSRRERWAVGLADAGLRGLAWPLRRRPGRPVPPPRRILLLRLERIGDLLMALGAIRAVRALAPEAEIDLVVGSWNVSLARLIAEATSVQTLDATWLARGGEAAGAAAVTRQALRWRARQYNLAINFEGDIRSHGLLALSGARRRVGHGHAGGGPLLTDVVPHDPRRHVADNALSLVEQAFDLPAGMLPRPGDPGAAAAWRIQVPDDARRAARALLGGSGGGARLAVHAPGGRLVKQWPPERFADAAIALARESGASVVLTGAPGDETIVADVERRVIAGGVAVVQARGAHDLVVLAAVLEQSSLLLTGDTGPMHLAASVGTPVLAVFGPSMPWRYAPLVQPSRIVRVDLPCSPCNRIRRPPERCQGQSPDCLTGVSVAEVVAAGRSLMVAPPPSVAMEPQ